ncbi:autotransporter domain-containing protein, partial [Sutterella sp.]|uniref:autotransporter outer membrane beta-barrel domain-containing protein n=1 Tax=Sutterella sp. TaxID=1981025 RepID=UPI0026E004B4
SQFTSSGNLTIANGITVSSGSATVSGTLSGGATSVTSGSLTVAGTTTNLKSLELTSGTFTASFGSGTVTVSGAISLSNNSTYLASGSTSADSLSVLSGSQFTTSGDLTVSSGITVNSGSATVGGKLSGGETSVTSGTLTVAGATTLASLTLADGDFTSTAAETATVSGALELDSGSTWAAAGTTNVGNLTVSGGSTFGIAADGTSGAALASTGAVLVAGLATDGTASKLFATAADLKSTLTVSSGASAEISGELDVAGLTTVSGSGSQLVSTGTASLAGLAIAGGAGTAAAYFTSLTLTAASTVGTNALLYIGSGSGMTLADAQSTLTSSLAASGVSGSGTDYTSILVLDTLSETFSASGGLTIGSADAAAAEDAILVGTGGAVIVNAGAVSVSTDGSTTTWTVNVSSDLSTEGGVIDISSIGTVTADTVLRLTGDGKFTGDSITILTGSTLLTANAPAEDGSVTFTLSTSGSSFITDYLSDELGRLIADEYAAGRITAETNDGAGWIGTLIENAATAIQAGRSTADVSREFGRAVESAARLTALSGTFEASMATVGMLTGMTDARLGFSAAGGYPASRRIGGPDASFPGFTFADASDYSTMTDAPAPAPAQPNAFAGEGTVVWAAPVWSKSRSDGFGAGPFTRGLDADFTGIALGVDWAAGDSSRLGIALEAGTGDADSTGSLVKTSTDYDFYGVTGYFGRVSGPWSFAADLSLGLVDGDLSQANGSTRITADVKSKVFSAGAKVKYAFATEAVDVAPYLGLRVSAVRMDGITARSASAELLSTDAETKTFAEVPVGVQFSKALVTPGGTAVRPVLDLSVIPVIGDRDLESTVRFTGLAGSAKTSTEVLDRVNFKASLGVTAGKGPVNVGLGVSWTGSSNADNYAATASFSWRF